MEQFASKRARRLRVGQKVFPSSDGAKPKKVLTTTSANATPLMHSFMQPSRSAIRTGASYWSRLRPVKFPRLREWPFLRDLGRAAVKIKRIVRESQSPHRANRQCRPAVISAHRSMVGPVGNGGGGVFQTHCAHPVAHEQLAFDEVGHFTAHVRRKVVGERIADIDVINAMPQFDTLAVVMQTIPNAIAGLVKRQHGGQKFFRVVAQFLGAVGMAFQLLKGGVLAHHPDILRVAGSDAADIGRRTFEQVTGFLRNPPADYPGWTSVFQSVAISSMR